MNEVPKHLVFDARSAFSTDGEQHKTSCKKREMKFEFRLLNDILSKTITVKAASLDAVTHERFLMMAAILCGVKINWGRLLFNLLKEMLTPSSKKARAFAVQICIIQKGAPALELGESKDFPPFKILTAKTVGTYIDKNKSINDKEVLEVPVEKMVKKAATKRRPAPAVVEPAAKKKRTTVLSNDEGPLFEMEKEKETEKEKEKETEPVATDKEKSLEKIFDSEDTEPLRKVLELTETTLSDEESMSIDDILKQISEAMMLPSVLAAQPTKIKFGHGIQIKEVNWYKASLPKIAIEAKGKEPLVEEVIKGHPTKETFTLICADIDFLVQIREAIIEEIVSFFHSFSLRILAVLGSVSDTVAKEEQILAWAETDSLQKPVQRRVYVIDKYKEMLLRKFLEARHNNFESAVEVRNLLMIVVDLDLEIVEGEEAVGVNHQGREEEVLALEDFDIGLAEAEQYSVF
ncbi:hypothetical protein F511_32026 [Dorcoceras hygrometricum]|uniref:Splicing factor 3B subunit 1-like n=1 Tax=Dorcoceras hygrometricum TaxID=472368 RepID=A0A2Z7BMG7_9LAMI|nr:hypothetical protein F511_32026 [Dorcoceras hygrometricum]